MYSYLKTDLIISEYDALYNEEATKAKREAAFNYVKDYAEKDINNYFLIFGIDEDMVFGFLSNDSTSVDEVLRIVSEKKDELELSLNNISTVRNLCAYDTKEAWKKLKEFILKKRYRLLYEKAGLTAKTWREFRSQSVYTKEKTQMRLSEVMNLSDTDTEYFKSLFLKNEFTLTNELKAETLKNCQNAKKRIVDFLSSCDVSQSTWGKITNSKKTNEVISQKILLRFANGFNVGEKEAKKYMAIADSGFYTSYDIAFLICIRRGYHEYYQVCEVMKKIR